MSHANRADLAAWLLAAVWVALLIAGRDAWQVVFVADWIMTAAARVAGAIEGGR